MSSALPTRVHRACDRCRRNKSRCDVYRPCSLCLRANAQCTTSHLPNSNSKRVRSPSLSPKRKRERIREPSIASGEENLSLPGGGEPLTRRLTNQSGLTNHSGNTIRSGGSVGSMTDVGGDSAYSIAQKIQSLQKESSYDYAVDAIPGANDSIVTSTSYNSAPVNSFLTHPLPHDGELQQLLDEYFDSIHWFSLVIVVDKFRDMLSSVRSGYATPSQKPFLLLLSIILGLSSWYKAHKCHVSDVGLRNKWLDCSRKMIQNAELELVDLLDLRSITAIQALILLGSYYVYHGRPNLSFSLVGATIKAAQSMGLHQSTLSYHSTPPMSHLDREERKRAWWTIYTWDRFASVNYGRPLSISEKVCSVEQPEDMFEEPMFLTGHSSIQSQSICYSPYQRELNKLYMVASPAIERVYRTDGEQERRTAKEYHVLVNEVTMRIWNWRRDLPEHLRLDIDCDWPTYLSPEDKAYKLQSLSLYLTFDSLILILHRPFMKQRLDSFLAENSPSHRGSVSELQPQSPQHIPSSHETSSLEHLWSAAVRTTKITELPQLAQHATDGHLINFLTMNLFNAAVVLIVMALSNPLTDRAQEAKRAVARVYRMQLALGNRSVLSQQSAAVLRSLVQLLTSRESEIILAPMNLTGSVPSPVDGQEPTPGLDEMTVRDALRMPLWMHFEEEDALADQSNLETDPAGRVNLGLESVQRAFAGVPVDVLSTHNQSRRQSIGTSHGHGLVATAPQESTGHESTAMPNTTHPTPVTTYGDVYAPIVDWRNMEPGADTGMHWLWNPALDNMFTDGGVNM